MVSRAEETDRPQSEAVWRGASIWPIVAVVGAALALPGFLHSLPEAARALLILAGTLIAMAAVLAWMQEDRVASARARWRIPAVPAAGPPRPYEPLAAPRAVNGVHLRAVRDIAERRLAFPTPTHRDFKTFLNQPQRTMGVQMPDGSVAYPDIVVVQWPENHATIVAQVETAETVSEEVACRVWGPYAELAPLYVYVPVGKGGEALKLCRRLYIPVAGVRTWRYLAGRNEIEISGADAV